VAWWGARDSNPP